MCISEYSERRHNYLIFMSNTWYLERKQAMRASHFSLPEEPFTQLTIVTNNQVITIVTHLNLPNNIQ